MLNRMYLVVSTIASKASKLQLKQTALSLKLNQSLLLLLLINLIYVDGRLVLVRVLLCCDSGADLK